MDEERVAEIMEQAIMMIKKLKSDVAFYRCMAIVFGLSTVLLMALLMLK